MEKTQRNIVRILTMAVMMIGLFGVLKPTAEAQRRQATPKPRITAARAKRAALAAYPGTAIRTSSVQRHQGKWEYGVTVRSGIKTRTVYVNAMTGKINRVSGQVPTNARTAVSSVRSANRAALASFPGKVVGKTTLVGSGKSRHYRVTVRSGSRLRTVMVNASTGRIDRVMARK